jgi:hypothetical protein
MVARFLFLEPHQNTPAFSAAQALRRRLRQVSSIRNVLITGPGDIENPQSATRAQPDFAPHDVMLQA